MFDHIEPKVKRPLETHHHITLWVLISSCLMLLLTFVVPIVSVLSGTRQVEAAEPIVRLWTDPQFTKSRSLVGPQENLELGRFTLDIAQEAVNLRGLAVTVEGLYFPADFSTAKFYLDETQVGHDVSISPEGRFVFTFDTLDIPIGSHSISIRTDWFSRATDRAVTASVKSVGDIQVFAHGVTVKPSNVFPQSSGTITFVEHGALQWLQTPREPQALKLDRAQTTVFIPLQVRSEAELIQLEKINWTLNYKNFTGSQVRFLDHGKELQRWELNASGDQQAIELADGSILVGGIVDEEIGWEIRGIPLRSGAEISLSGVSVNGVGYNSGGVVKLEGVPTQSMYLVNELPSFVLSDTSDTHAYSLTMTTLTKKPITVENLFLRFDADRALNQEWDMKINGESISRVVSTPANHVVQIHFKKPLTINSSDTLSFVPSMAKHDTAQPVDVILDTESLKWYSDSADWYLTSRATIAQAEAAHLMVE